MFDLSSLRPTLRFLIEPTLGLTLSNRKRQRVARMAKALMHPWIEDQLTAPFALARNRFSLKLRPALWGAESLIVLGILNDRLTSDAFTRSRFSLLRWHGSHGSIVLPKTGSLPTRVVSYADSHTSANRRRLPSPWQELNWPSATTERMQPVSGRCTACGEAMQAPDVSVRDSAEALIWFSRQFAEHRRHRHAPSDARDPAGEDELL